jgi:hypothetical protein
LCWMATSLAAAEPLQRVQAVAPTKPVKLLAGNSLAGWTTHLKDSGSDDPQRVFTVRDGVLHISGEGRGYVATDVSYKDFHLTAEYKWGTRTDGGKYVRNSGILLHGTGPDGGANGVWMTSIEVQLAQGCEGDLIVIRGKDDDGKVIPATITSETVVAADGKTRWKKGGERTVYSGKQFWWSNHEPGFKELLDTRGKDDVASPLGAGTKVECICKGDRITVLINGRVVNECFDVFPSSGKILLQNEGFEIEFRNVEIRPLK